MPMTALTTIETKKCSNVPPGIRKLLRRLPKIEDGHISYVDASIRLDTLVIPEKSIVVIGGDLVVSGIIDGRPLGSDPENERGLLVKGDIFANSIFLGSEAYVGGSLRCSEWLIAESDGDYSLTVEGDLEANRIVALGHHIKIGGKTTATFKIGYLGLDSDVPKTSMADAFAEDLVNEWGGIDLAEAVERVFKRQPILKRDGA
jgi:hypothetical protein